MLFEKSIVQSARDAYRLDVWSAVFGGLFMGATTPFLAVIARDKLHASATLIALITAAPCIGLLFSIMVLRLGQGKRQMPFVLWTMIFGRGGFIALALVTSAAAFSTGVALAQTVMYANGPAYAMVMREVYPDRQRGAIMGYVRLVLGFAQAVGTQLAGWLLGVVGFTVVFPVAAVSGIVSAIIFGRIRSTHVDNASSEDTSFKEFLQETLANLKHNHGFRTFIIATTVFGFGNIMAYTFYPLFQVDELHISTMQVAVLANTTVLFLMLTYPYWGRFIDRKSPVLAVTISLALSTLVPINYYFIHNAWALIPAACFAGTANACMDMGYFGTVIHYGRGGNLGQIQALHSLAIGVRGVVGPFLASGLLSVFHAQGWNVRLLFPLIMIPMAYGTIILYLDWRKRDRAVVEA